MMTRSNRRFRLLRCSVLALALAASPAFSATVVRETAGLVNLTDSSGNVWQTTNNFDGGWRWEGYNRDIRNTNDDALYRAEISWFTRWARQLPNGKYRVTLKMNDQWSSSAGQRVFTVAAEGAVALENIDVYKEVGANTAYDRTFDVEVKDNVLNLGFAASQNTPSIAAIQVDTIDINQPPADNAIRVGVSASPIKDSAGNTWEAASGFNGGTYWAGPQGTDIAGTNDDNLYLPELYGMTGWSRNVRNGNYEVTLKMREAWFGTNGQRVFNISAEGMPQLTNVDIHAAVGKNTAFDKSFVVKVEDGTLNLGFSSSVNNAILSAIQVKPSSIDPPEPPTPTGGFRTEGTKIIGPDGKEFIPIGANVGTPNSFNHNGTIDDSRAFNAVKDWKWNALRVNYLLTPVVSWAARSPTSSNGLGWSRDRLLQHMDNVVDRYTSQKIVVMLSSHDALAAFDIGVDLTPNAYYMPEFNEMWKLIATRYKNNPYVWFNIHNEPLIDSEDWVNIQDPTIKLIRATGANNIIVIDLPGYAQDLGKRWTNQGWKYGKFSYEPSMAPVFAQRYKNIVLSNHVYGGDNMYTTREKLLNYVNTMHTKVNLPLIFGEFGWHVDYSGRNDELRGGGKAVFSVAPEKNMGMFIWHATHANYRWGPKGEPPSDRYCLKNLSVQCAPFFDGGATGANLSELGQDMWNITH